MANYPAMYRKLFNAQTDAIRIMQEAQQETENMYIEAPEPDIHVFEPKAPDSDKKE